MDSDRTKPDQDGTIRLQEKTESARMGDTIIEFSLMERPGGSVYVIEYSCRTSNA